MLLTFDIKVKIWKSAGMIPVLRFQNIPARHAISTRQGGVSPKPFDSLNLSYTAGDSSLCVRRNRRRLSRSLNIDESDLFIARQVHGASVLHLAAHRPWEVSRIPCDALISTTSGQVVGVLVADCLPVLIAERGGRAVAAVHAGRKGIAAGILRNTVSFLTHHLAISPQDLFAGVGPGISRDHYAVDPLTATGFLNAVDPDGISRNASPVQVLLDLRATVHALLIRSGIPPEHIEHMRQCTRSNPDLLFSFREAGGVTGRFAALIQAK